MSDVKLVTDYPLLSEHSFAIPPHLELRGDDDLLFLRDPAYDLFTCCKKEQFAEALEPMINNLASMAFETEFPGQYIGMIRRRALEQETAQDIALWKFLDRLLGKTHDL